MNSARLPVTLTSIFAAVGLIIYLSIISSAKAAIAAHVVISQIQIGATGNAHQEFVELYNPTGSSVDITGWRLKDESGSSSANLVASFSASTSIQPHQYLLVAHPEYTSATTAADITYSATSSSITSNDTVVLQDQTHSAVIDKVGMGTATDKETADASDPAVNQSIIRKASATSDPTSLSPGGTEANAGNGWDTDDNSSDFVVLTTAMPRNSSTPAAPPLATATPSLTLTPTITPSVTPSITPSVTISETLTPTLSVTPTLTPTETLSPTVTLTPTLTPTIIPTSSPTPSVTPTESPTPSLTITPTETPTLIPSPSLTPTESPSPTLVPTNSPTPTLSPTITLTPTLSIAPTTTLTPTPTGSVTPTTSPLPTPFVQEFPFINSTLVCTWSFRIVNIVGIDFAFPTFHCVLVR